MSRQLRVMVNGNPYEVEVEDLSVTPVKVMVNGKEYLVEVDAGKSEGSAAVTAAIPPVAKAVSPSLAMPPARKPEPQAATAVSGDQVRAPMPGTILDVAVKPGQKVNQGQQLCALEAMKMKSAIRSPREGVISSVEVIDGQKVAYGDVIVRYE